MGVNFLMENYVPFLSKLKICLYFVIVKIYVYEIIENLGINKSIKGSLKHYRKKVSSIALKPVNIRRIRTGSYSY